MHQTEEMNLWADWITGLPEVFSSLGKDRISLVALVILTLLANILPENGISQAIHIVQEIFVLKLTYAIVVGVTGGNKNIQLTDLKTLVQLFLLNIMFNLCTWILMLLLVIPGIIWALRSSFAVNFVCQGMNGPDSIKASQALTKGNLKLVAKYLLPIPLLAVLAVFAISFGIGSLGEHGENTSIAWVFANLPFVTAHIAIDVICCLVPLTVLPLQVRMHSVLTSSKAISPDVVQSQSQKALA